MSFGKNCVLAALAAGLAPCGAESALGAEPAGPDSARGPHTAVKAEASFVRIASGQTVPLLARTDVLVAGSSLEGCFLAERLARRGRSVVLVSAGTSLPREIAMALRPWVGPAELRRAPEDVRAFLASCKKAQAGDEIILNMIRVTEGLEDRLLDAGVSLYYDLCPCGVGLAGKRVTAVVFACKAGLVAIEARAIVDATPDARVAALAGARVLPRASAAKGIVARYSMLCDATPRRPLPAIRGVDELADGRVLMHGSFAEFRIRVPMPKGPFRESAFDLTARRVAAEAAAALKASGALGQMRFVRGGDVVVTDPTRRIVSRSAGGKLSLDACRPRGVDGLLVCSPAADVDDALAAELAEPLKGPSIAAAVEQAPWEALCGAHLPGTKEVRLASGAGGAPGGSQAGQAKFTALGPIHRIDGSIGIDGERLPVAAECDVLVVGAGTSGTPAACVAAESGAETIVIEKYGDVGGTHTIGGVCKYWFGRTTNFARRLDARAAAMMQRTAMPKCMGMLDTLGKAGARLLTHCPAVGAVTRGRDVVGIVVVTHEGLKVIRAKRVIDATGDGDVAARAGAKTDYGTRRDAMTLWYSFARFRGTGPEAARHFDCVVDLRDPTDVSRAMISSRRRGRARGPDDFPQVYLTPRESRHIRGRCTVTAADILSGRRFEDVVLVCKSNFDIKGIADSDLFLCGYIEPGYRTNYTAQVPYRALQPAELDGILVVGKAYSVTHDALALARMQRDLIAMGGAAGLAAVRSLESGRALSAIDIRGLQRALVELGVLSEGDAEPLRGARGSALPELSDEDLRDLIDRLAAGKLKLAGKAAILARPKRSTPLLRAAIANAGAGGNLPVAKALCFLGDRGGAEALLADLRRQVAAGPLPMRFFPQQNPSPDHGYAPRISFLINLLGRLGDERVIPLLTEVARKVRMDPGKSDMMFGYVHSVCYAAERLGAPACVEALEILADKPGLRGGALPPGTDPRKTASRKSDRYAYLELCVGRALARCGSRRGWEMLLGYLGDPRGFLARSAHDELVAIAGRDLGYDRSAWLSWLSSSEVRPKPYRDVTPASRPAVMRAPA